jgi:hypothetical protein
MPRNDDETMADSRKVYSASRRQPFEAERGGRQSREREAAEMQMGARTAPSYWIPMKVSICTMIAIAAARKHHLRACHFFKMPLFSNLLHVHTESIFNLLAQLQEQLVHAPVGAKLLNRCWWSMHLKKLLPTKHPGRV